MRITNQVAAVVTGGASGLGLATANALAEAGARVAIFDLDADRGAAVAAEIRGVFCKVDVMSDESVEAGFAQARAAHGQERILVNCAGGARGGGKTVSRHKTTGEIRRFSMADFEFTVKLNVVATFRCITASAAGMLTLEPLQDGERGVIANTASVAAEEGQIGQAAYSAGKAAIVGLTLTVARDLAAEGIRINTIMPGIFATPPMLAVAPQVLQTLSANVLFPPRLGAPPEFASMVLESVRNTYLNGQVIRLDGGLRMPPR
jgi:NAD(P)-dependent dehydrogenase (short-subunit alcohol dehydrogenase family)